MQYHHIGYRWGNLYRVAKDALSWEKLKIYGIEQKLKIIRHANRYGTAPCCDAFAVKARTLRNWRRIYKEHGEIALADRRKRFSGRSKDRQARREVVSYISEYRQAPPPPKNLSQSSGRCGGF